MASVEEITALFEADQASGAKAVRPGDLPINYEAMTPEWLSHILCKDHPEARVTGFSLGERDDGSSNRRRVYLTYNQAGIDAGLPGTIFCKASHNLINRILFGLSGAAHSEVTFFNAARPLLDLDVPDCYYAAYDNKSFNSIIMLRDMAAEVDFCTHHTPINRARAESQITLLAGLHSRFWEKPGLTAKDLDFWTWPQFFETCLNNDHETYSNQGFLAAEEVIPARLYQRFPEIWPKTVQSVENHKTRPQTLLHDDPHLAQWYVRKGTDQMGAADWNCSAFGNWGRDVAYAISTALTIEDRRTWEMDLLRMYLDLLSQAGVAAPSFDEALVIYRQNLLGALNWWTITYTPSPGMPEMQPRDRALEFIKRISHAIDDLDALDAF